MIERIKITLLGLAACAAVMVAFAVPNVHAQQGNQQIATSSQTSWADSLRTARQENEALTQILSAIESIDTARQSELIQWIITDRTVRSRVISALRKSGYRISPNSVAELTVTQKPPTSADDAEGMQLLRLVIESVGIYGQPNIQRVLGQDLYERIRARDYELTMISTQPAQQKIQFVYMDASLFGGDIIFKSGFGFGVKLGNDYLGYPFWLPGTIGTYGLIRRGTTDFRIGLEWPLGQSGVDPFTISGGLKIRERKLAGAMAFGAEIKQELGLLAEQSGKLHFGLEFMNAFTPTISNFPGYAYSPQFRTGSNPLHTQTGAIDSIFYIAMSAHAYVQYRLPDNTLRGAYIQVGGGMHQIQPVTVGVLPYADPANPNTDLQIGDRFTYIDPFIKLGYSHTADAGDDYGVSIQYCNLLLADGWIKLFPWLQLEAKYATVVFRDPQKWEWKDYVMVSPKLTFNF